MLKPAPQIVAHRGSSHQAPENTLAAFDLAWAHRADAIEIDIRLCKSGEIVVMHDSNTRRTTGFEGEIAAMTLDEIKALDAGAWKGEPFAGESVPTLDEVLARLPADKQLFIEIKDAGDEVEAGTILAPLKTALENADVADDQIAVIGFNFELMRSVKSLFPHFQTSWLRGKSALKEAGKAASVLDETIEQCRDGRIDGLNLSHGWLQECDLERVRAAGLGLYIHTVNEGTLPLWIDGFMTDCPAEMRAQLKK